MSSLLTQDKWGDPLALAFPRQTLPAMETCSATSQPGPAVPMWPRAGATRSSFPCFFPPFFFFLFISSPFLFHFLPLYFPLLFLLSPSLIRSRSLTQFYPPLIRPSHLVPLQVPTLCSEQQEGQKLRDKPRMFLAGSPSFRLLPPLPGILILDKKWVV